MFFHAERTEEHRDLCKALGLIKDMIAAVDLKVSEYEKNQKWLEILNKIENKTYTKLKNGHVFRKQALLSQERALLHDGLVYWKTATGRFKGTGRGFPKATSPFLQITHYSFNTGQTFKRKKRP